MDKIKTVKIKNEDGTVSQESYYISADARCIDMANGKNAQETIGNIDIDNDGSIAAQLDNLNNDIKKKAYFFDTVADMKAANLKNGDFIITLGYYEANDGGAGEYKIVDGNYTDNGGSYHELDNGFYAEFIVENNSINVKQFGAYGDGVHDDTAAITNCINYVRNLIINNNDFNLNEPIINFSNRYLVSNTIILPPFIKYNCIGNVLFIGNVLSGIPILKVAYQYGDPTFDGSETWEHGQLFYGGTLRIIGNDTSNYKGIGIEIGNSTNPNVDDYSVARMVIQNISIQYTEIAIKLNAVHTYILNFNNIKMRTNDVGIQYGTSGIKIDSGEEIIFTNCLFGTSKKMGVDIQAEGKLDFIGCSFDYNSLGCIKCNDNINISLLDCHIEGIKIDSTQNCYGIIWDGTNNINSKISLTNVRIAQTRDIIPLIKFTESNINEIMLNNIQFSYSGTDWQSEIIKPENYYMVDTNNALNTRVYINGYLTLSYQLSNISNIINSDGDFSHNTSTLNENLYTIGSRNNFNVPSVAEHSGKKYLHIEKASELNSSGAYVTINCLEKIYVRYNWRYFTSLIYRLSRVDSTSTTAPTQVRFTIKTKFYDFNDNQIETFDKQFNIDLTDKIDDTNYKIPDNQVIKIPNNKLISYMKVSYEIYFTNENLSNFNNIEFTDINIEKI